MPWDKPETLILKTILEESGLVVFQSFPTMRRGPARNPESPLHRDGDYNDQVLPSGPS